MAAHARTLIPRRLASGSAIGVWKKESVMIMAGSITMQARVLTALVSQAASRRAGISRVEARLGEFTEPVQVDAGGEHPCVGVWILAEAEQSQDALHHEFHCVGAGAAVGGDR